jgi:type VI protein secretion system component VasF
MMMTPIEIIALIFIILAVVKMLFLLINPKSWMNGTLKVFGNKIFAQLIGFILA